MRRTVWPLIGALIVILAGCGTPASQAATTDDPDQTALLPSAQMAADESTPSPVGDSSGTGPWIVFQAAFERTVDVGLVRPDGTDLHRIPGGPGERWHPAWSPDGTRIVYDLFTEPVLGLITLGGSDKTLMTCSAPCLGIGGPAWSPDGQTIAFDGAESATPEHDGDLCYVGLLDVESRDVRRILEQPACDLSADPPIGSSIYMAFSPDGGRIVFQRASAEGLAIFTADVGGHDVRQLTDWGLGARPDWSPDGEWIVFQEWQPEQHPIVPISLYRIRPDGTGLEQLTHPAGTTIDVYPRFLPDGSGIIFSRCPGSASGECEARIISLDGSDDQLLFGFATDAGLPETGAGGAVHLMWQPVQGS
jgi:Tol biopolymer transport system component